MAAPTKPILFLTFSTEVVGPSPATGSIVNVAMIGLLADETVVFQYDVNLQELPNAKHLLLNDNFWNNPQRGLLKAYITQGPLRSPAAAFTDLNQQILSLNEKYKIIPITWSAGYNWQWINFYFDRFVGSNPLGCTVTCIDSYKWGVSRQAISPPMIATIPVPPDLASLPFNCAFVEAYRHGVAFVKRWRETAVL